MTDDRRLDDELMVQVAGGSESALESLISRHRDRLVRMSARLTSDMGHAEDIAQETFIRLVRHAPEYEGRGQFVSWLYTIARRLSLNTIRSRQRRPEVALEAANDRPSYATPEKALELKEVRRALAGLPERQRKALWLKAAARNPTSRTRSSGAVRLWPEPSGTEIFPRGRCFYQRTHGFPLPGRW
jgi:RNA polymerase sigma-70 factor (ECF subfamily)